MLVNSEGQYDMEQLVMVKEDFPDVKIVIVGGRESPYVS